MIAPRILLMTPEHLGLLVLAFPLFSIILIFKVSLVDSLILNTYDGRSVNATLKRAFKHELIGVLAQLIVWDEVGSIQVPCRVRDISNSLVA